MNPETQLDTIEAGIDHIESARLRKAERDVVGKHTGSVNNVPTAVVETACQLLVDDAIEDYKTENKITEHTARKMVVARCLASCTNDYWNGYYDE